MQIFLGLPRWTIGQTSRFQRILCDDTTNSRTQSGRRNPTCDNLRHTEYRRYASDVFDLRE